METILRPTRTYNENHTIRIGIPNSVDAIETVRSMAVSLGFRAKVHHVLAPSRAVRSRFVEVTR
jgi:hypothetical protein